MNNETQEKTYSSDQINQTARWVHFLSNDNGLDKPEDVEELVSLCKKFMMKDQYDEELTRFIAKELIFEFNQSK